MPRTEVGERECSGRTASSIRRNDIVESKKTEVEES